MFDFAKITEVRLERGQHGSPEEGMCFMEMVAWFEGEEHSDRPSCASRVLGSYGITLNDRMPDALRDRLLKPLVPMIAGTRGTDEDELRRSRFLAMWSINRMLPIALRAISLDDLALQCEQVGDIATALPLLEQVRQATAAGWRAAAAAGWRAAAADAAAAAAATAAGWRAAAAAGWRAAAADAAAAAAATAATAAAAAGWRAAAAEAAGWRAAAAEAGWRAAAAEAGWRAAAAEAGWRAAAAEAGWRAAAAEAGWRAAEPVWALAVEGLREAILIGPHQGFSARTDLEQRHADLRQLVAA